MPGRDATGPQGQGTRTGQGLGDCRTGQNQGQSAQPDQGNRGQGFGRGQGCRRRGNGQGFGPQGRRNGRFNR